MNWKINWFSSILLIYTCFGCAKEETFKVKPENKKWISLKENSTVYYEDNNQISHVLNLGNSSDDLVESSSSTLGITTNRTYTQSIYLSFSNSFYYGSFGLNVIKLDKNTTHDQLSFHINDLDFYYDLDFKNLTRVNYDSKSTEQPFSKAIKLKSFVVNDTVYGDVIHFQLLDFKENWKSSTVSEVYLAKEIGIIQFKTVGGLEFFLKD